MVVLSHTGVSFFTLSPGVMAVVVFYILAGFVVSHIYNDILPNSKYKLFHFYKDRLLRVFPLYLYVCTLTLIFITLTSYSSQSYSLTAVVGNAFIIPLNYYMYAILAF
jgi:peptidoglycan/LPS O-acetylase OafA/YrhL